MNMATTAPAKPIEDIQNECPNAETLAAMREAKNHEATVLVSMKDFDSFLASME